MEPLGIVFIAEMSSGLSAGLVGKNMVVGHQQAWGDKEAGPKTLSDDTGLRGI